jgi:hypothetical protein
VALVRVGPVRIAISALAPFRPPGWGSVGCRTFVELNLSGALDARHHLGDLGTISGAACQVRGTKNPPIKGADSQAAHSPHRRNGAAVATELEVLKARSIVFSPVNDVYTPLGAEAPISKSP